MLFTVSHVISTGSSGQGLKLIDYCLGKCFRLLGELPFFLFRLYIKKRRKLGRPATELARAPIDYRNEKEKRKERS